MTQMESSFGALLAQWMKAKDLSARQLAALTACSSKTTVLRLLRDQSSPRQCAAFLHRLKLSSLRPEDEELARMLASVSPQQTECEAAECNRLFKRLLRPVDDGVSFPSLDKVLCPVCTDARVKILCLGYPQQSVLAALLRALDLENTCVTHIMPALSGRALLAFISSNIQLLFQPRYQMYVYDESKPEAAILRQNLLLIEETGSGAAQYSILFPDTASCEKLALGNAQKLQSLIQTRLSECGASCLCGNDDAGSHPVNYEQFLKNCYHKERNCAIDQIKRDIGVEYLPISVVQSAFNDLETKQYPEPQPQVVALRRSLYARHDNLYNGKKKIRLILSLASMRRFVRSGRLSDHPTCLRSFTSGERREILLFLMDQAQNNPNFSLRFVKGDVLPWEYEIIGYQTKSIVIYSAHTDYDIQGSYRELELLDPQLVKLYHSFFNKLLSENYVESEARSVTLLGELVVENSMRISARRSTD